MNEKWKKIPNSFTGVPQASPECLEVELGVWYTNDDTAITSSEVADCLGNRNALKLTV